MQTLTPTAVTLHNLFGAVTDLDDSPDSPDSNWCTRSGALEAFAYPLRGTLTMAGRAATVASGEGVTGDAYVSSTGSNGNDGTEGSPYATIAYALGQISAGETVVVLDDLTENLALGSLSGGTSGAYKRVAGQTPVKSITGTVSSSGGASKYLTFQNLQFLVGTSQAECQEVQYLKFLVCGFFGGGTSGNVSGHLAGSNQLYESCWFGGNGGRYASLCYQRTNTLYRWCVIRTEYDVISAGSGNPSAAIQIYSSTDCARIQCVAVDCLLQNTEYTSAGVLAVVSNVGDCTGIVDRGCIVRDCEAHGPGFMSEGSNDITHTMYDCVSVSNNWGFVANGAGAVDVTIDGGEFSYSAEKGIASYGNSDVTASNVNTTNNTNGNLDGVTNGGGNTTSALNMDTLLSAMKIIGVSGTLRGETGWDTEQTGDLFPFPYEDTIRTQYATIDTRGFCGGSYTLTSYLKRAAA